MQPCSQPRYGIDRQVEAEVGRVVLREDRLDVLLDDRRLGAEALLGRLLVERAPAVVVALAGLARVAVLDRPHRAAALGGRAPRRFGTRRLVARDRSLAFGWRRHTVNIYSISVPLGAHVARIGPSHCLTMTLRRREIGHEARLQRRRRRPGSCVRRRLLHRAGRLQAPHGRRAARRHAGRRARRAGARGSPRRPAPPRARRGASSICSPAAASRRARRWKRRRTRPRRSPRSGA